MAVAEVMESLSLAIYRGEVNDTDSVLFCDVAGVGHEIGLVALGHEISGVGSTDVLIIEDRSRVPESLYVSLGE